MLFDDDDDVCQRIWHQSSHMMRMAMLLYCNCYAICSEIAFRAIVSDPPRLSDKHFLLGRSAD